MRRRRRDRNPRRNPRNRCGIPPLRISPGNPSRYSQVLRPDLLNRPRGHRNHPVARRRMDGRRWEGRKEREEGEGEEGGIPIRWQHLNLGPWQGVSVSVFVSGGAGYTKPNARRPSRKGKKQQGQQVTTTRVFFFDSRMREWVPLFLSCFSFVSSLLLSALAFVGSRRQFFLFFFILIHAFHRLPAMTS
jgi:hypothetical protein